MRSDILNSSSGKFADEIVVNANHVEYHGADVTLNAVQDVGGVHIINKADVTVTLPAVATGCEYTIVLGVDLGSSEYMRVDPNASDKFTGGCNQAAGTDGKYIGVTGVKAGACIKLCYGNANGWMITHLSSVDNWTHES